MSIPCISSGGLFILWHKGEELITASNPHFTVPDSTAGSSSTLTIESANHTLHTGEYQCIAIFPDSSQASAGFNITVQCKSDSHTEM